MTAAPILNVATVLITVTVVGTSAPRCLGWLTDNHRRHFRDRHAHCDQRQDGRCSFDVRPRRWADRGSGTVVGTHECGHGRRCRFAAANSLRRARKLHLWQADDGSLDRTPRRLRLPCPRSTTHCGDGRLAQRAGSRRRRGLWRRRCERWRSTYLPMVRPALRGRDDFPMRATGAYSCWSGRGALTAAAAFQANDGGAGSRTWPRLRCGCRSGRRRRTDLRRRQIFPVTAAAFSGQISATRQARKTHPRQG